MPKAPKSQDVKCGRCGSTIKKSDMAWVNQTGDTHLHVMEVTKVNPGEATVYFHGMNTKGGSCHRAAVHLRQIRQDRKATLAAERKADKAKEAKGA